MDFPVRRYLHKIWIFITQNKKFVTTIPSFIEKAQFMSDTVTMNARIVTESDIDFNYSDTYILKL